LPAHLGGQRIDTPSPVRAPQGDWGALLTFLPFFWPKDSRATRVRVVAGMLLMGTTAGLSALAPLLFASAVDALSRQLGAAAVLPTALLVGYGLVFMLTRVFSETRWIVVRPVAQLVHTAIKCKAYEHIHGLGLRFHLTHKSGQLIETINRGVGATGQLVYGILLTVVPVVLDVGVVAVVLVVWLDPIYAAIVVVTFVTYGVALIVGAEKHRPHQRRAIAKWQEMYAQAVDSLINHETVKYFTAEDRIVARVNATAAEHEALVRIPMRWRLITEVIPSLIMGSGFIVMMWVAGRLVMAGELTIGSLVLVNAYLLQVLLPFERISQLYRDTKQAMINIEGLMGLFAERPDVADAAHAAPLPAGGGGIEFRGVSFAYDPRRPILDEISFPRPRRQHRRPSGCQRGRQDHRRTSVVPLLRAGGRANPGGRPRRARLIARVAARGHWRGAAGHGAVQ
jgi:ATP-binding cassette subfamily B protein